MEVMHVGTDVGGAFVAQQAGRRVGELAYVRRDDSVVLKHTWVEPRMRGQGLAGRLVQTVLDVAQSRQWQVVPECAFAEYALRRNPAWSAAQPHRTGANLGIGTMERGE